MNHARWIGLIIFLGVAFGCSGIQAPASSGAPATSPQSAPVPKVVNPSDLPGALLVCHREEEERRIEIQPKNPGCVLQYTKSGKTREAASSKVSVRHCEIIRKRMREHLEAAGFKCQS